jgi:hypothetical protein
MASSIGKVLDIESPNSYIKRPVGPMVTVKVRDISKLAGIIRIPSMSEGAKAGETTAQRILYSGLPNQCRKCRRLGTWPERARKTNLQHREEAHQSSLPLPKGAGKQL